MPYKQKLKTSCLVKQKKSSYKVTNWTEYNKILKQRGKLSLYLPTGDLKSHFINASSHIKGISGQKSTNKRPYIELIYIYYRFVGLGMRQITGYFEDIWQTQNLKIAVPSFGHLSDSFSAISLEIKQFCQKLEKRIENGESVTIILDSTGLRFGKASHWYEEKYGKPSDKTPWRKMHLSIDPDMNMHAIEITDWESSDTETMDQLIPEDLTQLIEKVIADGGYYSIEGVENLYNKGIIPVIPPHYNSVVHGKESTTCHDKIVQYIKDKGTVYAFHKKYGYGCRAFAESQISRIKRCIGSTLQTQKIESQKQERIVIANIINKWNSYGRCVSVKVE